MTFYGVMITYRRPEAVAEHVECLLRQSSPPDVLVVVDNAPDSRNEESLSVYADSGRRTVYLPRADNPGPAGGFGAALEVVLAEAGDEDWVVLLDDDDPPFADDLLEELLEFGRAQLASGVRLAAVGLTGVRFDTRVGRTRRYADDELRGPLVVDLIGGNQLPCFRVAAVRTTGMPDARLFWGYEELDYDSRLRRAGYELRVPGEMVRRCREHFGRLGSDVARAELGRATSPWRQYYTTRNLVYLMRTQSHVGAAAVVSLRGVVKALYFVVRRRPGSRVLLTLTTRGVVDGWRGRLGRSLDVDDLELGGADDRRDRPGPRP